jgi:hypothetical protein
MLIPDPDPPHPGSGGGVKKALDPGSTTTLIFFKCYQNYIDLEAMYSGGELFGEHRVLGRRGGEGGGDRGAGVAPRVQALVTSSPFQT